jgi:hypothetical protein
MSSVGAAPRAAAPISNARAPLPPTLVVGDRSKARASRKNGAKSRGPKTRAGQARVAQNALKHGLRARIHVLLPDEDAAEFAALRTSRFEELAPEGRTAAGARAPGRDRRLAARARRSVGRRNGVGAPSPDRKGLGLHSPNPCGDAQPGGQQVELFAERRWDGAGVGVALIRDGNGTRSFETRWPEPASTSVVGAL